MIDFVRMRWLIKKCPRMEWEVEKKMAAATRITSCVTGMPRGGKGNRGEDAIIALSDVEDAYKEILDELKAMRKELAPLIDNLEDPDEKAAMRMRYIQGHRPTEIAKSLYRTDRSIYIYLKRAERRIRGKQNG